MIATALRPQQPVIGADGRLHKTWEFDYLRTTFYVQEFGSRYAILEEGKPGGIWLRVQPQRRQMILAEFKRVQGQQRP
jgi:hypothetical protein